MNSKADTNIYLLIIVLLAILVCYLQPKLIFPALILFGVIYYFSRQNLINREIFFSSYLDNIIRNIERTNHFAVRKLDVGIAVFPKMASCNGKMNYLPPGQAKVIWRAKSLRKFCRWHRMLLS